MDDVFQEAVFWVLAVATVGGALLVVHLRDVFRAALALGVTFLGIAGLFALLSAEFLAVVQVLIYAGAIAVLIIFAVMLTRDVAHGNPSTPVQVVALTVGALLLGLLGVGALWKQSGMCFRRCCRKSSSKRLWRHRNGWAACWCASSSCPLRLRGSCCWRRFSARWR